eukprot:jgi/Tetstr1/427508/TSEL_017634.t1
MPDGEEPVAEPTLESMNADLRAQSSLLRDLATAVGQLTARDRVVGGEGAHGSGSGQRFAGQPTGSGGAAERPDLLELAQSGRVGAKSVSAEDDYLAVPELLQRAESGYEAVRPVSRVPGLFPLSTDLTNEYLKQDDRRLPAQEEYLWMSCFGAHMAALFVALDELLPYVPAANQDFTPYLARARNHAEAIDKAFRFRLAFLRRLNEIKRVHGDQGVLDLQLQVAGVGEDVAAGVGVAAKEAFGSDELGQLTLDMLSSSLSAQTLKSYAGRLSQFAEFCHDSENIYQPAGGDYCYCRSTSRRIGRLSIGSRNSHAENDATATAAACGGTVRPSYNLNTLSSVRRSGGTLSAYPRSSMTVAAASDARSTLSELPDAQVQTINSFIDELLEWNQKMNITAIRTREEAMSRHVEDSLALLPVLEAHAVPVRGSDTLRLIDVGSGGGLPGLLLAIARPQWQVTLLDSLRKRCDFVTATIKKLGIQNVTVVWSRAEDAGQNEAHREEYDVAVARAVAEMRVLVELCLPLVRTNGCLVAAKGPTPEDEISKAKKALSEVKGHVTEVIQVASFGSEGQQFTAVVVKKEQTCPKKTAATHLLDVSYRYNTRKGYNALQALKAAFAPPPETYISTLEGSLSTKQSPHEDLESFIARLMLARLMLDRAGTIVTDAKLINHSRDGLRQPDFKSEYDHLLRSMPDTFLEAAKAVRLTSRAPAAESTAAAFLAAPPPSQPSAVKDGKMSEADLTALVARLKEELSPPQPGAEDATMSKLAAMLSSLASGGAGHSSAQPSDRPGVNKRRCYYCGSPGHPKRDCRSYARDKAAGRVHPDRNPPAGDGRGRPDAAGDKEHAHVAKEFAFVATSHLSLPSCPTSAGRMAPVITDFNETDESKAPAEPVESAAACHESKEPEESGEPAAEPDALEASAEPKSPHRRNRHLRRRRNHAVRRRNHAARQAACAFLRISEGDYDASSDNSMPGAVTDSSSGGTCTPCDWSPPQERPPTHYAADYPDAVPPSTPDAIDQLIMMTAVDNFCDTASDVDVRGDDGNGDSDSEYEHDALERAFHWRHTASHRPGVCYPAYLTPTKTVPFFHPCGYTAAFAAQTLPDIASTPPLPQAARSPTPIQPLPSVTDVKADPAAFTKGKPIRILSLCAGALHSIVEGLAEAGVPIGDMICCETDKHVRKAGRVEQERMQARHPHRIPASAIHDSYGRINPDVQPITDDELASLGHVDLVIASPPCAPFSAANPHRLMLADPRAGGLYGSIDVVKRMASMQSGGVNFILENVPGATRCHEIVEAMGTPILHGLFSKFVSRRGSYAYRMTTATTDAHAVPGKSMLLLDGEPETPCLDIVAVSMGFPADTLDIPRLSLDQRRMMQGACIDANIGKWLALAIVKASASEVALPIIKSFPQSWVLDTGATSHMVANISDFADYKPISPRWIHGLCARAVGIGTVRTTIPDDNGTAQTVVLRNVLHVPDLAFRFDNQIYRLFSSRQAEEQNAHLHIIINSRGSRLEVGDTVFPVESVDRMYMLHNRIERSGPPASISLVSAMKHDSKYLWHARLGHIYP